jgi:hypothetical protein
MRLEGESKYYSYRANTKQAYDVLVSKVNDKDAKEEINILLMTQDLFSPSHNCSDSDVTYSFLGGHHDTIFNDTEMANIHSELSKIP